MWPFNVYRIIQSRERYIWVQVRILHETNKAILVTAPPCHPEGASATEGSKLWIPKSQIYSIRLRKSVFEIYARESIIK